MSSRYGKRDSVVYPMYAMVCDDCGYVGALWEKPGTGASYVDYCVSCGERTVVVVDVENLDEWQEVKER